MDRVIIITGLRIQALHMVNAQDYTYSKGYLGLLSALGISLGIVFYCMPIVPFLYRHYRLLSPVLAHSNELGPTHTEIYNIPNVPPSIPKVLCRSSLGSYDEWVITRRASPDVLADGLDHWACWKYRTVGELDAVALKIYDRNLGASISASDTAYL